MHYICPICAAPLTLTERTYSCDNRHSFDLAKEGYVNLLPANHKHSKNPGDSKEMMQARREFLGTDHYQNLALELAKVACELTADDEPTVLLDLGCGEGYYTDQIRAKMATHTTVYGLDISKVAVRYAAKRYPQAQFSVASSYRLPFADNSLDIIVKVYAPCSEQEILRCLKPGGKLVSVTPSERHLYQLRERIYDEVRPHKDETEKFHTLSLSQQSTLHYTMDLSGAEALSLLQMTPFAWKANDELRQQLADMPEFKCEADFIISCYHNALSE
ncbi:23S rRNA (guanine(745)-N(1))-methyltransferase [Vibrio gallicus]|uniref:23S rRNA (guanine(745)-N(1))-methyltransferase n=1 Tax=Vibrio gallicus TaxID=190897 RepID=UPI0021C46F31|nr:23S rRNA (guanine(745)-N(1))-methyltransferase [Vibrio gallicus]